jgi:YVTN family beta-propeller protein
LVIAALSQSVDAQPNSEPFTPDVPSEQDDGVNSLDDLNRSSTIINMTEDIYDMAVDPDRNLLYVTTWDSPTLFVIDGKTNKIVNRIMINSSGSDIAVNSNLDRVYALSSSQILEVIEDKEYNIVANVTLDHYPVDIAVNTKTNKVYIPSDDAISVIDGESNEKLYNVNVTFNGTAEKVAVNPENNRTYVTIDNAEYVSTNDQVLIINGTNDRLLTNITVPDNALDIDVNPETMAVYITNDVGNRISAINGTTSQLEATIRGNFTDYPEAYLAVDDNPNLIYVITAPNTVSVINGTTNAFITNLTLQPEEGEEAEHIVVNRRTNTTYVGLSTGNIVSLVNVTADKVLTNQRDSPEKEELSGIKVGWNPSDIAVNPETNMIYVIYSSSTAVSVIDGNTDSIINTIALGSLLSDVDVNPLTNTIYLISRNDDSDSVIAIDGATMAVKANITINEDPRDLAINLDTNRVYTLNLKPFQEEGQQEESDIDPYETPSITIIDGRINSKIDTFNIKPANGIALDTNTDTIFAYERFPGSISKIAAPTPLDRQPPDISEIPELSTSFSEGVEDIAINSETNLLYVANGENVSETDPYTETIIHNYSLPHDARDIAVNPETNMVYVTSPASNTVSVIDATAKAVTANASVGDRPRTLAINSENNMIYVANSGSDTISVINGHTKQVASGVTFKTNPSNSGYIDCNDPTSSSPLPIERYTRVLAGTQCTAIPNEGFAFVSWEENLEENSTQLISPARPVSQLDSLLEFLHLKSSDKPEAEITIKKFGTFTANFRELPPPLPPEYLTPLYGIIASTIVGWSIPSIIGWIKLKRDVGKLNYYHKEIATLYGDGKLDENDFRKLDGLRDDIVVAYSEGKINDKHYDSLKNETSILYEKIFRKRIDDAMDNANPSNNKNFQEHLAQIRTELKYAYSEGKINDKHYDLLNKDISDYESKKG